MSKLEHEHDPEARPRPLLRWLVPVALLACAVGGVLWMKALEGEHDARMRSFHFIASAASDCGARSEKYVQAVVHQISLVKSQPGVVQDSDFVARMEAYVGKARAEVAQCHRLARGLATMSKTHEDEHGAPGVGGSWHATGVCSACLRRNDDDISKCTIACGWD